MVKEERDLVNARGRTERNKGREWGKDRREGKYSEGRAGIGGKFTVKIGNEEKLRKCNEGEEGMKRKY